MAFRLDRSPLRSPHRTATGVRFDAHITRVGVFEYIGPKGEPFFELRLPEEVFAPASLKSFEGVPVTDNHPPKRLDTKSNREFQRGLVGEGVRADGDKVAATLFVNDADLIAKIDGGKCEVSNGYECDLEIKPGVWNGIKYDAIQRNIRGNHVAIVDEGRAGPECRLRMDAAESIRQVTAGGAGPNHRTDSIMDFEKLYKEALAEAAREKARADAAEATRTAEKARADKAEGELAAEKARADKAEKERTDTIAATPARVAARVSLLNTAGKVLHTDGKPDDLTAKTDREIKIAYVEKVDGVKIPADASEGFVDGYFESASKRAAANTATQAGAHGAALGNRLDAKPEGGAPVEDPETAAKRRMNEDSRRRGRSDLDPAVQALINPPKAS